MIFHLLSFYLFIYYLLFILNIIDSPTDDIESRLSPSLWESLLPYQKEGVKFAVAKNGKLYIADEMGLGMNFNILI